jgi:hypothetical protein
LRFQPTQREAWLVDLDGDAARTEGDLCARHAVGLVLPRGWQLHNALTTPLLHVSESVSPPSDTPAHRARTTSIARARRRRTATAAVELPGLTAVSDAGTDTDSDVGHEAEEGHHRRSRLRAPLAASATREASETLAETLNVRTPLLRRAFSNVRLPDANAARAFDADVDMDEARNDTA